MLVVTPKVGYQNDLLEGVCRYTARLPRWSLKGVFQNHPRAIPLIRKWRPHGIIGLIEQEDLAKTLTKLAIPSVDVSTCLKHPPGAMVQVDDQQIGRSAADFFLAHGFQNFGFLGHRANQFSLERLQGFSAGLQSAGMRCQTKLLADAEQHFASNAEWFGASHSLANWLEQLPRPAAVLCSNDQLGLILLNTCRRQGLSVPFDIAALGVDDNAVLCHLASPTLSSIRQPGTQIGFRAAQLLDEILQGKADPRTVITLQSPGISERDSTRHQAIADPQVARAMRLIHAANGHRVQMGLLTRAAGVSRRTLELRFRRILGHSIGDEIQSVRVAAAEKIVGNTDMKLSAVAHHLGFANSAHLTETFRKHFGCTPSSYRQQNQRNPAGPSRRAVSATELPTNNSAEIIGRPSRQ